MVNENKLSDLFVSLKKVLVRFEEIVLIDKAENDRIVIDAAIQRFEFTFELFWKNLKKVLENEGYGVKTPKESLQQAYQIGWIDDEVIWLNMLRDRNLTSHTYNEFQADEIYKNFPGYLEKLKKSCEILEKKLTSGT